MPIEVKDVNWSETEQYVVLNVPLKGAASKNVDIFSTNLYIKVSYPPYFYELALHNEVDDENSKATVTKEQVNFHLKKRMTAIWGQLNSNKQKDKEFMKDLRANALKYRQVQEEEKAKERDARKTHDKKFAVKEQMKIDNVRNEKIKEIKDEEAKNISKDMDDWKNKDTGLSNGQESEKENLEILEESNEKSFSPKIYPASKSKTESNEDGKVKSIPKPRASGSIQVSFTPRVLATPARESKLPEEECWLRKVAEFNKMKKTDNKDAVDMEEMNPLWLKDKGNGFFKKGNIVAAINAYSSALMLDSKMPMIYSNRAACHLSLKQYNECIQDCTCALELYHPPVPANALSRCRALSRRGAAYFQLQDYVNALRDYEDAIKLDPKNEGLIKDATRIRHIIEGDVE